MIFFARHWFMVVLMIFCAAQAQAAPVTTQYYSLDLPADWVVAAGPEKRANVVSVLLGRKDHKSSASLIVGAVQPGEAEKAAKSGAERLKGSKPVFTNGQWHFTFEQQGVKGYSVVREDPKAKVLLILMVSGDTASANFVYAMRSPYKALIPQRP